VEKVCYYEVRMEYESNRGIAVFFMVFDFALMIVLGIIAAQIMESVTFVA